MIVLDTNVLSELMRSQPPPVVVAWVAAQPRATLFTTSVRKAEILYGIAALPKGQRSAALVVMFTEDLATASCPLTSSPRSIMPRSSQTAVVRAPPSRRSMRRSQRRPWRSAPMSRRAMSAGSKGVASP